MEEFVDLEQDEAPNERTLEAMRAAENGGTRSCATIDALIRDLDDDQD